ncbi:MAG TPA: macro domain-containing protein [Solirubrobacteraceae bacterium]|nr:macro domain-containing protein [Solirubrobacteraceae bacterium]
MNTGDLASERIEVVEGDMLVQRVDALVNPANERLEHGGGLARLMAAAAGPELERESREIGFVATGKAVATTAGRLPQRYVLHTPGPVWRGGGEGEPELLASCHRAVIALAAQLECESLALPAISTGIFGYPLDRAAPVAVRAARDALSEYPDIALVRFCVLGETALSAYRAALGELGSRPRP